MAVTMDVHIPHELLPTHFPIGVGVVSTVAAPEQHLGDAHASPEPGARAAKRKRAAEPSHSDDSGDLDEESQTKRRPQEDAKRKHNITSQKGRAKINSEIDALKDLMPECRGSEFNKARVLHYAVDKMRLLMSQMDVLAKENARLQRQNEQLWEEMRFLKAATSQAAAPAAMPFNLNLLAAASAIPAQPSLSAQQQQQLAAIAPFLLGPNLTGFNANLTSAVSNQQKQDLNGSVQTDQVKGGGLDPATAALLFGANSPQNPNLSTQPVSNFYGLQMPATPLGLPAANINLATMPHLGLNMNDIIGMIGVPTPGATPGNAAAPSLSSSASSSATNAPVSAPVANNNNNGH